jgi:hypothetical protein
MKTLILTCQWGKQLDVKIKTDVSLWPNIDYKYRGTVESGELTFGKFASCSQTSIYAALKQQDKKTLKKLLRLASMYNSKKSETVKRLINNVLGE